MKFSVNNQDILKALQTVSRAISSKTSMPILECVYLEAKDKFLYLKGSNTELSIISKIPAAVSEPGKVVIPIKTITNILRTYPDELVLFTVNEQNVTNINCQGTDLKSDISILGRNALEYPKIDTYKQDESFLRIEHQVLKNMIKDTVFACAYSEGVSPILTGVLVEYEKKLLHFTALDGYKLAVRQEVVEGENDQKISCIVPGKTLSEILKILAIYEYDTYICINGEKFIVNIGDTQIISNILEGDFIQYQSMIPSDINTIVKAETKELLKSIERASLITDVTRNSLVRMDVSDNMICITSESDIGKVVENVNVSKNGADLKIAFNSKYLIEILKIIDDERIIIECKNELSPTLIKPVDSDDFLYLIMPVRYVE